MLQAPAIAAAELELPAALRTVEVDTLLLEALDQHRLEATTHNAARQIAQDRALRATESLQAMRQAVSELELVPCGGTGVYAACPYLERAMSARETLPAAEADVAMLCVVPDAIDTGMFFVRHRTLKNQLAAAASHVEGLRAQVALKEHVESARVSLDRLQKEISTITATLVATDEELLQVQERLAAAQDRSEDVVSRRLELQQRVALAANAVSDSERALGEAEGQWKDARAAADSVTAFQESLQALEATHAEWVVIAQAVSPTGIPALRIDTALPAISGLATDILATSFKETRYTVELISQKPDARGKKTLETLEVVIRRDGDVVAAKKLCGGESILVSESLALGISMYRGPVGAMLLRDEIAASLDQKRARVYVEMLRSALRQSGQRLALFVTHEPACVEAADAKLVIRHGRIDIE